MKFVKESLDDSDVLVLLIDINGKDFSEEIQDKFERSKAKKIVVLNKIDKVHQQKLEEKLVWLKKTFIGDVYLAISAQEKFQIDVLEKYLIDFYLSTPPIILRINLPIKRSGFLSMRLSETTY